MFLGGEEVAQVDGTNVRPVVRAGVLTTLNSVRDLSLHLGGHRFQAKRETRSALRGGDGFALV